MIPSKLLDVSFKAAIGAELIIASQKMVIGSKKNVS